MQSRSEKFYIAFMAFWLCLIPIMGCLAPRAIAYIPPIIGLIGFFSYRYVYGKWAILPRAAIMTLAGIPFLMALSGFWAIDPQETWDRAQDIGLLMLGGGFLLAVMRDYRSDKIQRILPYVTVLSGLLLLLDLYGNHFIYALTHPDFMEGKTADALKNMSHTNRAVVVYVMSLGLSGFALHRRWKNHPRESRILAGLLITIAAAVLYATNSQSVHLSLFIMLLALALPYPWRHGWAVLSAAVSGLLLSAPWLTQWMFQTLAPKLDKMEWFSQGYAAPRMEIWDYVSRRALEQPWLGHGAEATRVITDFDVAKIYTPSGTILHPHNFAVQIWIEFGALGAILMAAMLSGVFWAIWQLREGNARMMCTMFLGILSIASTAYGLWQGWWIGLIIWITATNIVLRTRPSRK